MATFVLVPGAWLGGWCWKYVAPRLRDEGHDVYTPTLTGLGERVHLADPDVDLETHVTDVVNVIEYEGLDDVVLVGHSYAGLVVTEVASRVADRLAHVLYLDGLVPPGDEAMSYDDIAGGPPEASEFGPTADDAGAGDWRLPMPEEPPGWVGIDEEDAEWMRSKAVPHPVKTFTTAVSVDASQAERLPHSYVLCTENGMDAFLLDFVRGMASDRGWELHELSTGHWPMVSQPDAVVERLLAVGDAV